MRKSIWQAVIALGLAGALLIGCKGKETSAPEASPDAPAQSATPQRSGEVLFKAQRDALDKARAVEGQLQQQAQEQAKAIDAAQK
jgi:hypothetical protein